MWNGSLNPNIRKHRDYLHTSFYTHALANGADVEVADRPVPVAINPITEEPLSEEQDYFKVTLTFNDGKSYVFLIVSDTPGKPSEEEIEEQITRYVKNPVRGGRDISDYIADIDVEELIRPRESSFTGAFRLSDIIAA